MKMQTDLDISTYGIYSDQKLLFEMIDNNAELGLGTDLDLSGHKIKQGTNNVLFSDQNGIAMFPNGTSIENVLQTSNNTLILETTLDIKNNFIYLGPTNLLEFTNNHITFYQPVNFNNKQRTSFTRIIQGSVYQNPFEG